MNIKWFIDFKAYHFMNTLFVDFKLSHKVFPFHEKFCKEKNWELSISYQIAIKKKSLFKWNVTGVASLFKNLKQLWIKQP